MHAESQVGQVGRPQLQSSTIVLIPLAAIRWPPFPPDPPSPPVGAPARPSPSATDSNGAPPQAHTTRRRTIPMPSRAERAPRCRLVIGATPGPTMPAQAHECPGRHPNTNTPTKTDKAFVASLALNRGPLLPPLPP